MGFLDSLGHSGLKNVGLPPGAGSGCFQSSQDIVNNALKTLNAHDAPKNLFLLMVIKL